MQSRTSRKGKLLISIKMKEIFTISLDKVRFWGFHGVFPEEKVLGNWFTVNLSISLLSNSAIQTLDQTIDYGSLYAILKKEMSMPTELLEVLAENIKNRIVLTFPSIHSMSLEIQKQKPSIGLIDGNSIIKLTIEK